MLLHGVELVEDAGGAHGVGHHVLDGHERLLGGDAADIGGQEEGRGEGEELLLLGAVKLDAVEEEDAQPGDGGAVSVDEAVPVNEDTAGGAQCWAPCTQCVEAPCSWGICCAGPLVNERRSFTVRGLSY